MTERRQRGRPRGFNDTSEQNTIQSLDRAVTVLQSLAQGDGPTLTQLAERLDQSPATLYRVLSTLAARGMVEADPVEQTWYIGPHAFQIGSSFLRRTSLVERARPYLRSLMETTGETANLGVDRQDQTLFLAQVETHATIRAFFPPGTQSPLYASGIGKAMMAQFSPARLKALLERNTLTRFTATTLTDPAAIFNAPGDPIGGISVSGPSGRMSAQVIAKAGALVHEAAAQITHSLGGGSGASR